MSALDDTLYIATGPRLYSYDSFFCLRELTPSAGCALPFVALDVRYTATGAASGGGSALYAATGANVYLHPANPASPSCGAPLLTSDGARSITSLRVAPTGALYYTDRGAVYLAPPSASLSVPVALVQDGGAGSSGFVGVRAGLALWGEGGLLFGAKGTINGTHFHGLLAANAATGAPAAQNFFSYSSDPAQRQYRWEPMRLTSIGSSALVWSELRAGPPSEECTLQRMSAQAATATAIVTGMPYTGTPLSLAGDGRGQGAVWYAPGGAAVSAAFGGTPPAQRQPPLFGLDLTPLASGPVTGLAFAQGSPTCGYPFAYSPAAPPPLTCAPQPRAAPNSLCAAAPAAVVDALVRQAAWVLPVAIIAGLLGALAVVWACARALRARCSSGSSLTSSGAGGGASGAGAGPRSSSSAYSVMEGGWDKDGEVELTASLEPAAAERSRDSGGGTADSSSSSSTALEGSVVLPISQAPRSLSSAGRRGGGAAGLRRDMGKGKQG